MINLRKRMFVLALFVALAGCDRGAAWSSGDRVLVSKCAYDTGLMQPERYNVVVFKYPRAPIEKNTPKNYIKRLWGLPGELLAIFFGQVYRWVPPAGGAPLFNDSDVDARQLWKRQFMHENDEKSRKLFDEGEFTILRKAPDVMLALRRIVHDHDHQAADLIGKVPPRWNPDAKSGWKAEQAHSFVHKGDTNEVDWLRYQHLLRPKGVLIPNMDVKPQLITDTMGYNSYELFLRERLPDDLVEGERGRGRPIVVDRTPNQHWVGDLMLECRVDVVEPKGEFTLELSQGIHRFQARWDLTSGACTLYKLTGVGEKEAKREEIASAQTRVKAAGSYTLRLANFDARLTVWVDGDLPFQDGVEYPPPEVRSPKEKDLPEQDVLARRGPTENDLQPASLSSKGAHVKISHLRLWRDTYYTTSVSGTDYSGHVSADDWGKPSQWGPLRHQHYLTIYVQPGHYLVMGDNSPNSSDSRDWGTVPERLLLGRALVVYYPFQRAGAIR
jgi:signal peptidase I